MTYRTRIVCFALLVALSGSSVHAAAPFVVPPVVPPPAVLPALYFGDDLARVPELIFETTPAENLTTGDWMKRKGRMLGLAEDLNLREKDGFIKALIRDRRDLRGLPFLLGDDCRKERNRSLDFESAATTARSGGETWSGILSAFDRADRAFRDPAHAALREDLVLPRVAAVSQIMWPVSGEARMGLVKYLSRVPHAEATRELARLAVFAPEPKVGSAALAAISTRRDKDSTDVIVKALRYPWPTVAERAAEAVVKLKRKDLLPELVALLDEPDPRSPQTEKVEGRKSSVTRELVRINHHKNCLLCHAPADATAQKKGVFVAEVPLPSEALPSPSEYYRSRSDLLVRIDMTYMRQDFSLMQRVQDAKPWPEMQRFDLLVRKRILTDAEAKDLRERLTPKEGELSPYQKAALKALRELTGRDLPARAEPWRKLLKLQAKN